MDDLFTPEAEVLAPETTNLVAIVESNPVVVFTDNARREKFYEDIKAEVTAHVPDVSTAKGRDAIKSLAFKVTKCKTGIDKAGMKLTEDARAQIDAVNAARRDIRERLEALADEAREPLTKWEKVEDDRKRAVQAFFDAVDQMAAVTINDTSATVADRLAELQNMRTEITTVTFDSREQEARDAVAKTIEHMEVSHARLLKEEADRAELERLRAEAEKRRQDEEARVAAEAECIRQEQEAKAKADAEESARQAEADRLAQVERDAAERAAREAEAKARAEQDAKDREYEAKIAEATRQANEGRQRAEAAEAAQKAEADRIEAGRLAKEREDAAARAADEKRQADQKHRTAIMKAAKLALMEHADIAEDVAKRVILAIVGNSVPAVSIKF